MSQRYLLFRLLFRSAMVSYRPTVINPSKVLQYALANVIPCAISGVYSSELSQYFC